MKVDGRERGQASVELAPTLSLPGPIPKLATLVVRPRGWHLEEKHLRIDGEPVSASLFDFGLYFFHNARELLDRGSGPYFYLPKLENHLEARLWNEVFELAQDEMGIPRGTIRATVLIETVLAAFEMDEILYQLRDHAAGLNAGRWDYLFSIIKNFRDRPDFLLPDRGQLTMTVPFMRAYTELLVKTCHRRGAHAIGGMAAFIPSRRDPEVNETALARVREDKAREARAGYDGAWVAHPDLVPVVDEVFRGILGSRPHQKDRQRDDVDVRREQLLDVRADPAEHRRIARLEERAVGVPVVCGHANALYANLYLYNRAVFELERNRVAVDGIGPHLGRRRRRARRSIRSCCVRSTTSSRRSPNSIRAPTWSYVSSRPAEGGP